MAPGSTIKYMVRMDTIGDLSTEVVWSIKGNNSSSTYIAQDGTLYIAEDETSKLITVRATSAIDSSKYGRATVVVDVTAEKEVLVTGVAIVPNSADIVRGRSMRFQAVVSGVNLEDQDVTWSINGQNHVDTRINADGILQVAKTESASVVIVTVTSVLDPTKSDYCAVSITPEEAVVDAWEITSLVITPEETTVGQTYNTRFACIVDGINNPPQDVIWEVAGNADKNTHISKEGVLFCGANETVGNILIVTAQAVFDPDKIATAKATVLSKDSPEAQQTTVTDIIIAPMMITAKHGEKITFKATVLGQNNPSQSVTWTISGQQTASTLINNLGVLTVALDETAKTISVYATSTVDKTKQQTAFVIVSDASITDPKSGIGDVPELPLGADYVRRRDISGKSIWVNINELNLGKGGRGGYLGTFKTIQDLRAFTIPEDAEVGDYAIVVKDENYQNFPTMYTVVEAGGKTLVFEVVLGRPMILGDKLDILYVLDNINHSTLLRDIETLEDFDTNQKRYELAQSEAAWKLVTKLHKGFWNMIKHHPDMFKALVAMDRETGAVKLYMTCFTDNHEWIMPISTLDPCDHIEDIANPRTAHPDTLTWNNTIQPGAALVSMSETEYIRYNFNWDNFTLEVAEQIPYEKEKATAPGVSPWATIVGEYTMLANGDVIGPLEGVTDSTGYLWVSNRENFMVGSAGDGTQMFVYNIDDDTWFIFDVPSGKKKDYHFATDLNERYFMFWIESNTAIFVDRKQNIGADHKGIAREVRWKFNLVSSNYNGLSEPNEYTRPSISVDGQYYLHTSTNAQTPMFTTFRFSDGECVREAGTRGTSSSAIGLSDGNKVMSNTPEGQINLWNINDAGQITQTYANTPEGSHRYVVVPTGDSDRLLFVKVKVDSDGSGIDPVSGPAWFVFNPDKATALGTTDRSVADDGVVSKSAITDKWCEHTNPQGKGCAYKLATEVGPAYLLTFAGETNAGLLLQRDESNLDEWKEYEIPFGGLYNDSHSYNQPGLLNGTILMTTDEDGTLYGYDVVNHTQVDVQEILDQNGGQDANSHFVQIDDSHFAWCTATGISIYRIDRRGNYVLCLHVPEQQGIVHGFNDTSSARRSG